MVYILYGDDDFSIKEYLRKIIEDIGGEDLIANNVTSLDGQGVSLQQLCAICDTVPFLAPKRLVIVDGLLSRFEKQDGGRKQPSVDLGKAIVDYLNRMPESTVLVLIDRKVKKNNALLVAIAPYADVREFNPLYDESLKRWIHSRVARSGHTISPPAIHLLADLIGNNLWMVSNEIEKLCTYTGSRRIEEEDIRLLVSDAQEANVFTMVDAVLAGNTKIATKLLHDLEEDGTAPPYLLYMITRQFRMVIQCKDLLQQKRAIPEIGKSLGIKSEYAMQKTIKQAKAYSLDQLCYVYKTLLDTDVSIKTGKLRGDKGELALDLLVNELCLARKQ